ncbi:MAG: hypothetical protein R3D29_14065 [Nitratireductor sp.]
MAVDGGLSIAEPVRVTRISLTFKLASRLEAGQQSYDASGISGSYSGNAIKGNLRLAMVPSGRPRVRGELAFSAFSLPGREMVTGSGTSDNGEGWPKDEFRRAPLLQD